MVFDPWFLMWLLWKDDDSLKAQWVSIFGTTILKLRHVPCFLDVILSCTMLWSTVDITLIWPGKLKNLCDSLYCDSRFISVVWNWPHSVFEVCLYMVFQNLRLYFLPLQKNPVWGQQRQDQPVSLMFVTYMGPRMWEASGPARFPPGYTCYACVCEYLCMCLCGRCILYCKWSTVRWRIWNWVLVSGSDF